MLASCALIYAFEFDVVSNLLFCSCARIWMKRCVRAYRRIYVGSDLAGTSAAEWIICSTDIPLESLTLKLKPFRHSALRRWLAVSCDGRKRSKRCARAESNNTSEFFGLWIVWLTVFGCRHAASRYVVPCGYMPLWTVFTIRVV